MQQSHSEHVSLTHDLLSPPLAPLLVEFAGKVISFAALEHISRDSTEGLVSTEIPSTKTTQHLWYKVSVFLQ